ncbi:hypothetical protein EYF80_064856 [Liparis tanakae]|uniref:Uncharacterized protein n=1 Tax=Liparis tanakae TaxID=230148 RepID=A0A4Z2E7W0_9TELE|nr:hypothetical protein EYF80_064856 [Liparis tanakae]
MRPRDDRLRTRVWRSGGSGGPGARVLSCLEVRGQVVLMVLVLMSGGSGGSGGSGARVLSCLEVRRVRWVRSSCQVVLVVLVLVFSGVCGSEVRWFWCSCQVVLVVLAVLVLVFSGV